LRTGDVNGRKKTVSKTDDAILSLIHKASAITLWIVGLLFVIGTWGVEIGPLLASLGVAGIAIAFALQTTLGNVLVVFRLFLIRTFVLGM